MKLKDMFVGTEYLFQRQGRYASGDKARGVVEATMLPGFSSSDWRLCIDRRLVYVLVRPVADETGLAGSFGYHLGRQLDKLDESDRKAWMHVVERSYGSHIIELIEANRGKGLVIIQAKYAIEPWDAAEARLRRQKADAEKSEQAAQKREARLSEQKRELGRLLGIKKSVDMDYYFGGPPGVRIDNYTLDLCFEVALKLLNSLTQEQLAILKAGVEEEA